MENTTYTPTAADLEDFERWCFMQDLAEQEEILAQIWADREREAFL